MALSPWPSSPAALALATSTLKDAISPGAADATIQRLGATAAGRVEKYAPGAPEAVKEQAVIQYAGYLIQSNPGPVTKIDVGAVNIEKQVNHAAAFRHSGAMALLSPYKARTAVAIA